MTESEVAAKLLDGEVSLDWSSSAEADPGGRALVVTCGNLVVRYCPNVRVLPETELGVQLADLVRGVDHSARPDVPPRRGAVRVVLGGTSGPADVTASSRGWLAYVSGLGEQLPDLRSEGNVIGSLGAAAFAAAEVFKRLLPPRPERGRLIPATAYSIFEYGPSTWEGPNLPHVRLIEAPLLVGVGAVGQACVDALAHLGAAGHLVAVDNGFLDDETNLNRSVLAQEDDLPHQLPKVFLAERRAMGTGLTVTGIQGDIADIAKRIDRGEMQRPNLVLSALDDDVARYRLQLLWPDLLLEGATGDTLAQIFRFTFDSGLACLRCIHTMGPGSPRYEALMAERTGVTIERIRGALMGVQDVVRDHDIRAAPVLIRPILERGRGRDLCGVLGEIERYLGPGAKPIQPSVSFTSYLAGLFLAAEGVRSMTGLPTVLPGRYQIDPIATLSPDRPWAELKDKRCYCVSRDKVIALYRSRCALQRSART